MNFIAKIVRLCLTHLYIFTLLRSDLYIIPIEHACESCLTSYFLWKSLGTGLSFIAWNVQDYPLMELNRITGVSFLPDNKLDLIAREIGYIYT